MVGAGRKQHGILTRIDGKLRRRGLKAHVLKNWRDTAMGSCDILLIGCEETDVDPLIQRLEHLWTQKWNNWYAEQKGEH